MSGAAPSTGGDADGAGDPVAAARRRGACTFMGLELLVAEGVLVPRAETELLGRVACEALAELGHPAFVVDMCCGSGNLACALSARFPSVRVLAADLGAAAVQLARRNADALGLGARVEVVESDLFAALEPRGLDGQVDLVVCNPPYISSGRLDARAELLAHEPRAAFDGGPYGLSIQQRVVRDAARFLAPGGLLAMEIGAGQARQASLLFARADAYEPPTLTLDASGEARVVAARRKALAP